jgi:hypothetical protein
MLCHNMVSSLNIRNQKMSIFDFNIKLSFNSLVNVNAGLYVNIASFISPVSVK